MLSIIKSELRAWREEIERRRTILALLDMKDRQLEDIGYSRGMLEDALSDPERMSFKEIRQRSKRELAPPKRRLARRRPLAPSVPCCGKTALGTSS